MHDAVLQYVASAIESHDLGGDVLDIGGRDVNGTPRHLFPGVASYTVVDFEEAPNVDIVADAADLNLADRYDLVISTEVLEHAERAADIIAAARRHLRPHGVFVATMAGPHRRPHSAHGDPDPRPGEFYRNVTEDQLDGWLEAAGFYAWTIDDTGLDMRCTAFTGG